jgi:NAD(P)-dependent dehydrogenase (short-subunit alcohol dehydrogenase family)
MRRVSKLQGRRILVMGGSSGMGFSVAEVALQNGPDVVISSSNEAKLLKAVDRLRGSISHAMMTPREPRISSVACDLGDAASLEENLTAALE